MNNPPANNTQYWLARLESHIESTGVNVSLADLLGVSRSSISQQKHGVHAMGVRPAVAAAYALEVHPMLLVASTQYDSATEEHDRIFWLTTYMKWRDKAPRGMRPPIEELLPGDHE